MQLDELRKILRDYLEDLIEEKTGGNKTQFAKLAGIAKPNLVTALLSKEGSGRYVSIEHLCTISEHQRNGLPSLGEMLTEITMRVREKEGKRKVLLRPSKHIEVETPEKRKVLVKEDAAELAEFLASGDEPMPSANPPTSPHSHRRPRRSR